MLLLLLLLLQRMSSMQCVRLLLRVVSAQLIRVLRLEELCAVVNARAWSLLQLLPGLLACRDDVLLRLLVRRRIVRPRPGRSRLRACGLRRWLERFRTIAR